MANDNKANGQTKSVLGVNERQKILLAIRDKELEIRDPHRISKIKKDLKPNEYWNVLLNHSGVTEAEQDKIFVANKRTVPNLSKWTNEALNIIKHRIPYQNLKIDDKEGLITDIGMVFEKWHTSEFPSSKRQRFQNLSVQDIFNLIIGTKKKIDIFEIDGLVPVIEKQKMDSLNLTSLQKLHSQLVA